MYLLSSALSICHFISRIRKRHQFSYSCLCYHIKTLVTRSKQNADKTIAVWITSICSLSFQWVVFFLPIVSLHSSPENSQRFISLQRRRFKTYTPLIQATVQCQMDLAEVNCSKVPFHIISRGVCACVLSLCGVLDPGSEDEQLPLFPEAIT